MSDFEPNDRPPASSSVFGTPPPPPASLTPPPGYVAYGSPNAAMLGHIQPIGGLVKAIAVLLIINVPLQLFSAINLFSVADNAKQYLDGQISEDRFRDSTSAGISSLAGILFIPIAVLTMIIMFRMASNLRSIGRAGQTFAPGWAIGGWFCPPGGVYAIPWLMFRELWKGSDPSIPASDPAWKQAKVSPLLNVWWVLYGLLPLIGFATAASMFSNFGDRDLSDLARSIDDFHLVNAALAFAGVITTVVYLVLIRQLAARHMQATHEVPG